MLCKSKFFVCIAFLIVIVGSMFHTGSVAALPNVEVTVDQSKIIGINNLQLGVYVGSIDTEPFKNNRALRLLAQEANVKLVAFMENRLYPHPCISWNQATKTGKWDWSGVDLLIQRIFEIGAEPFIALGYVMPSSLEVPSGMSRLPASDQWGAYCREWVKHFKSVGLPVRYYDILHEAHQYYGMEANTEKLLYMISLFNAAAKEMRAENPDVLIGNDDSMLPKIIDYYISNGEDLDFFCWHRYLTDSKSESDSSVIRSAESNEGGAIATSNFIDPARQKYYNSKGVWLPVIQAGGNVNWAYSRGTDPRLQNIVGAVCMALSFKLLMLKGVEYNNVYTFGGSGSENFGIVNVDTAKPYYPYYVYRAVGPNLGRGDSIVQSSSSSSNVSVIAWLHGGKLKVLLVNKVTGQQNVVLNGVEGNLSFQRIDSALSGIQTGTVSANDVISMNGYTVMMLDTKVSTQPPQQEQTFDFSVTDLDTGRPVAGANVRIVCSLSGGGTFSYDGTTNSQGYVRIAVPISQIAQTFSVSKSGYTTYSSSGPPQATNNVALKPIVSPSEYSQVTIQVTGQGTTNPKVGNYTNVYLIGSSLTVTAVPAQGWKFALFKRNGVEATWSNPGTFDNLGNIERIDAVFIIENQTTPPSNSSLLTVFEDNFESGDFSKWTGTTRSSGESLAVVSTLPYEGTFHGSFTSDDNGGTEYASCYRTIDKEEVWASGYFYVASGLPLESDDDRFYFLHFTSGQSYLAGVGIRRHEGADKWVLYGRNGSGWVGPIFSASPAIEMNQWYRVELHWKKHATNGVVEAFVNGERILAAENVDTAGFGNVTTINFGLALVLQVQKKLDVYGDCFAVSEVYIGSYVLGDINRDGSVNILDLFIFAQSFGSVLGGPRWNPDADLNKDGIINIFDIMILAMNFGR